MESLSERRLAENELLFKRANMKVVEEIAQTKALAAEHGQPAAVRDLDELELRFYCECSDIKCRQRVPLSTKKYLKIHNNKKQFTLSHGHDIPQIEDIVQDCGEYIIVEKHEFPPKPEILKSVDK